MLEKNTFRYQVTITTSEEYVDLQFAKLHFSFDLNEDGLPLFPKWVKEKPPSYMLETLEKMMIQMRKDDASTAKFYLDVEHAPECAEVLDEYRFVGIPITCSCKPVLHDPEMREYWCGENSLVTCDLCNVSSTGEIGSFSSSDYADQFWVWKDDQPVRAYWEFVNKPGLICDDCLKEEIAKTKHTQESV